jgi:hypothetical protein
MALHSLLHRLALRSVRRQLSRFASFPPPHLSIAQASLALRSVRRQLLSFFHSFGNNILFFDTTTAVFWFRNIKKSKNTPLDFLDFFDFRIKKNSM